MGSHRPRGVVAAVAAAVALALAASSASAAVTIGQIGNPESGGTCADGFDWVQPTVTSGTSFVVPGPSIGTIMSWTTFGGPESGDLMTMKVFRAVPGQPDTYRVVGHAGPAAITPGGTAGNTFPANVPVRPGDVLGLHTSTSVWCLFSTPGEINWYRGENLADGESGDFTLFDDDVRLNIQATFAPDNTFSRVGKIRRNKKKGIAFVTVQVPNPGVLVGFGGGAKVSSAGSAASKSIPAAGPVTLKVRAKKRKKLRKLKRKGKVVVKPRITYTPTGGDPSTQKLKVKLKRKRRAR